MDPRQRAYLIDQTHRHGYAYLRDLAAAEAAILRGQFNVAKLLRAVAHTHRILGMQAARFGSDESTPTVLFETNLAELDDPQDHAFLEQTTEQGTLAAAGRQSALVREQMRNLLLRAIASLEAHSDVMESDVAQALWGCYNCGYVAEAVRPDACPICGALGVEFQLFGPFYSATPEHLGQLTPAEIVRVLAAVPGELTALVTRIDEDTLSRKPSATEWSVKEILGHMLETDAAFAKRVRTILDAHGIAEIGMPVPPWKLHEGKGYETMPVGDILERMKQNRALSLELVQGLSVEQWARRGVNAGTSTSVLDLGTWLTRHDQGHSAQIRQLIATERSLRK